MTKASAGILLYRKVVKGSTSHIEVLLVHPGGPYWAKKDINAWSVPKGEIEGSDDPKATAYREFEEETGQAVPAGPSVSLGPIRQQNGKEVVAWAVEGEIDKNSVKSNLFEMEWPPRSGKKETFEEVDRAEWFDLGTACTKIHIGQEKLLRELAEKLNVPFDPPAGITEQVSLL